MKVRKKALKSLINSWIVGGEGGGSPPWGKKIKHRIFWRIPYSSLPNRDWPLPLCLDVWPLSWEAKIFWQIWHSAQSAPESDNWIQKVINYPQKVSTYRSIDHSPTISPVMSEERWWLWINGRSTFPKVARFLNPHPASCVLTWSYRLPPNQTGGPCPIHICVSDRDRKETILRNI